MPRERSPVPSEIRRRRRRRDPRGGGVDERPPAFAPSSPRTRAQRSPVSTSPTRTPVRPRRRRRRQRRPPERCRAGARARAAPAHARRLREPAQADRPRAPSDVRAARHSTARQPAAPGPRQLRAGAGRRGRSRRRALRDGVALIYQPAAATRCARRVCGRSRRWAELFDPHLHEAVATDAAPRHAPHTSSRSCSAATCSATGAAPGAGKVQHRETARSSSRRRAGRGEP